MRESNSNSLNLIIHITGHSLGLEEYVYHDITTSNSLCGTEDHAVGKEKLHYHVQKSFIMVSGSQDPMYNACPHRNLRPKISATLYSYHSSKRCAEQEWRFEDKRRKIKSWAALPKIDPEVGRVPVRPEGQAPQRCSYGLGELTWKWNKVKQKQLQENPQAHCLLGSSEIWNAREVEAQYRVLLSTEQLVTSQDCPRGNVDSGMLS